MCFSTMAIEFCCLYICVISLKCNGNADSACWLLFKVLHVYEVLASPQTSTAGEALRREDLDLTMFAFQRPDQSSQYK